MIEARSLEGHRLRVRAKHYVLACGAIENARLLLNSDDVHSNGLGNTNDLVGRYFMAHPHGRIAHIESDDPAAFWAMYRKRYPRHGPPVAPALVASEALQRRAGILNSAATFKAQRTPKELAMALGREFHRLGLGKLTTSEWLDDVSAAWPVDPTVGNHPIGGYHHMGTTRMSANPAQGVVDANCTVHGVANLHIAGSSVFTTGGWANPTLTILALARRLAQHLDQKLG